MAWFNAAHDVGPTAAVKNSCLEVRLAFTAASSTADTDGPVNVSGPTAGTTLTVDERTGDAIGVNSTDPAERATGEDCVTATTMDISAHIAGRTRTVRFTRHPPWLWA
jgi:hypothetical protein